MVCAKILLLLLLLLFTTTTTTYLVCIPVFRPNFQEWKCKEVNLAKLASFICTLKDYD